MNIFQNIGKIFASAGLIMSSFLGFHHASSVQPAIQTNSIRPSLTARQDDNSSSFYTISRSVTYEGYSANIFFSIPKNGGPVSGNITGDCRGKISGEYDGKDNGIISGQADATCGVLIVQIPGTATFNGTINKSQHLAHLQINAKVSSFEKTQTVTLALR